MHYIHHTPDYVFCYYYLGSFGGQEKVDQMEESEV